MHRPSGRLLVASILVGLAACTSGGTVESTTGGPDLPDADPGACADGEVQYGVDVSEPDGTVEWEKVAESGKVFAFARVSDGANSPDGQFAESWSGMKAAGLIRGAYQRFQPGESATLQADLMIAAIGPFSPGDLPPVIDVETTNGQPGSKVVSGLSTWIARVKEKTGRDPLIRADAAFWDTLPDTAQFAGSRLWVVHPSSSCPVMPSTWTEWAFWHYTAQGEVSGASGPMDLDVFNGSLQALSDLAAPPVVSPDCTADEECNEGMMGTEKVCSNSGATAGQCITGCHADGDCPAGQVCDQAKDPWACASPPKPDECPVLVYPSGVQIQSVKNAAMTASYGNHLSPGQSAPLCFLDVSNLHDPAAMVTYDINVKVADHFQLSELVGTEVNQGYGNFVLMRPEAVTALEKFRVSTGGPVSINSGFRGPKHQEDVCESLCGDPLGCPGTCANSSRHMWGDAFDLPLAFYSMAYQDKACAAGFKFTYLEAGTHLHIDMNPAYATCVKQ